MDLAWVRREVRKLYVRKAAQVGVSEAVRNIFLHLAMREPDPAMLILPDEKTGKRVMSKRILPLFDETAELKNLRTDQDRDQSLTSVLLANGFGLQLAWTGSAATLAADPVRTVVWDETDKSKEWDGKESGVGELIDVRTATYENSLFVAMSTPTTSDGPITELAEAASIKLFFFCPCPRCGHYQQLAFERIRYPKRITGESKPADPGASTPTTTTPPTAAPGTTGETGGVEKPINARPPELKRLTDEVWHAIATEADKHRRAELIDAHRAAYYECEKCAAVLLDSQRQRMLLAGYWGTEDGGYKLFVDGHEEGAWPVGGEVSMHYPAQLSLAPKHKYYKIAAEHVRCAGNDKKTQGFRNSWLGEAFKIVTIKTQADHIRQKKLSAPEPMIVPAWAQLLCITVDVQGNDPTTGYFYYVVRAWGFDYRSQLIDYGIVNTFEEMYDRAFTRTIPHESGGAWVPQLMLIDSGNRKDEVYQFVLRDPARIKPTKGASGRQEWPVSKRPQKNSGVVLWLIDTEQSKDALNRLIHDPDPATWCVHNKIGDDYCQQLASEEKIFSKKYKRVKWEKKTSGTPNHLLDCEQQQWAAAYDIGLGLEKPPPAQRTVAVQRSGENTWLGDRPGNWMNR